MDYRNYETFHIEDGRLYLMNLVRDTITLIDRSHWGSYDGHTNVGHTNEVRVRAKCRRS